MFEETIHFRLGRDSRTSICDAVPYDPDDDDTICLTVGATDDGISGEKSGLITTRKTMNVCDECWKGINIERISEW